MKLIFASSPSHELLKRHIFLGTLCEPWELVELNFDIAGDGNYRSPSWNRIVADRNLRLLEILRGCPDEVVVFSDVDIQWFRPCQDIIRREMEGKDMVFQREMPGRMMVNFGFCAIRCNERTVAFFEQIVAAGQRKKMDQDFVNELIGRNAMPLRYGFLPPTFLNDNLDGHDASPDAEIVLYHSINTFPTHGKTSLQSKFEKHLAMRARVLGSDAVFRSVSDTAVPRATPRVTAPKAASNVPPRNYTIQFTAPPGPFKPPMRCSNLIIHPNGRLYGESTKIGCYQWRLHDDTMQFFDGAGRIRFAFEKMDADTWKRRDATGQTECRLVAQPPVSADIHHFEIVVARYREDLTWADCYPKNLTIYSKNGPVRDLFATALPNLGREGGTYLFHIVEHYERLADRTLFLQGNPFPHPLLPLAEYSLNMGAFIAGPSRQNKMTWSPTWAHPEQPIDAPAMRAFLELLECNPTIDRFDWVQGAQFAVTREHIQKRPRRYFEKLFEVTQQEGVSLAGRHYDNHHVAWLFELFWQNIFD